MIPIALDTETDLIAKGRQAPPLSCVSLTWCDWDPATPRPLKGDVSRLLHWTEWDQVLDLLLNPTVRIVGHTIEYDMVVMAAHEPALLPLIFDAYSRDRVVCIAVREKLLDIAKGRYRGFETLESEKEEEGEGQTVKLNYDLDSLSVRRLRRKLDKNTWRLRYGELRPLPLAQWPEGAKVYPIEDSRATFDVYAEQEREAHGYITQGGPDYLADQYRQSRKAFWLRLMSVYGIPTDPAAVENLEKITRSDFDALAKDLRAAGLLRPDRQVRRRTGIVETEPGSRNTKLAAQLLVNAYARKGQDYPRTKKGGVALDEQACLDSGDPTLKQYAKFTSLGSVLNKDVPALRQGLIHTRWESLLESGRVSSSGNAQRGGMNIQNIRRLPGVRECFVPRCMWCGRVYSAEEIARGRCLCGAGLCVLASCDWSGAELATHGQVNIRLLGRSDLANALNQGLDAHMMLNAELMSAPYTQIKAIHDAGAGPDCSKTPGVKCHCAYCEVDNNRQVCKIGNFGFQGGMGATSFVEYALANYGVHITLDLAKTLKRIWLKTWPEMRHYFAIITRITEQPFPIIEQLFSGRWRGGVKFTEACNTMFQGLAADMANEAGWLIAQACYVDRGSPLFGCRPVNFIHDEFILEVPEERGHEAAQELSRLMTVAARKWVPDVKIQAKPQLMRRWSKKAKPVFNDLGRLVPWG